MCMPTAPKSQAMPATPQRDDSASLAQNARATVLRARGVQDTIATSALGDPGFGRNVRATKLGQTMAA